MIEALLAIVGVIVAVTMIYSARNRSRELDNGRKKSELPRR